MNLKVETQWIHKTCKFQGNGTVNSKAIETEILSCTYLSVCINANDLMSSLLHLQNTKRIPAIEVYAKKKLLIGL
jgi:hypothetical protein